LPTLIKNYLRESDLMKNYLNNLFFLIVLTSSTACSENFESTSNKYSGLYEQVSIAVTPDMRVIGVFKEERGDNFSCIIGFTGTLVDGKAKIKTAGEGYDGELSFNDNFLSLSIPKGQDHPGCGMTIGPGIATGIELGPRDSANWIDVKIVKRNGSVLYSKPERDSETLSVLEDWKVVGVLEEKDSWSKVSYFWVENTPDGWVEGFKEGWVENASLESIK
jgi:hypothetical protein